MALDLLQKLLVSQRLVATGIRPSHILAEHLDMEMQLVNGTLA